MEYKHDNFYAERSFEILEKEILILSKFYLNGSDLRSNVADGSFEQLFEKYIDLDFNQFFSGIKNFLNSRIQMVSQLHIEIIARLYLFQTAFDFNDISEEELKFEQNRYNDLDKELFEVYNDLMKVKSICDTWKDYFEVVIVNPDNLTVVHTGNWFKIDWPNVNARKCENWGGNTWMVRVGYDFQPTKNHVNGMVAKEITREEYDKINTEYKKIKEKYITE